MTSRKPRAIWLIGPNGSGKSTFYHQHLSDEDISFINADVIKRKYDLDDKGAQAKAKELREYCITNRLDFCAETVASHPSKIDEISHLVRAGYEIVLIVIGVTSADLNVARVGFRVTQGGHTVPEEKIRSRRPRTLQVIRKMLEFDLTALFYDNSGELVTDDDQYLAEFQHLATLENGELEVLSKDLPAWARDILKDFYE